MSCQRRNAIQLIAPCIASFLLTAGATPLVIRAATACRCLDLPGGRRLHKKATPRWGGVAFFAGVLPFLMGHNDGGTWTFYILASLLLVGMGIVDDLRAVGWKSKMAVMTAAATAVIFGGGITVETLGTYGSLGRLELGPLSIPFTYLSIIGVTNAINLLDGLDGLAGGVSLIAFFFMGIAAFATGNIPVAAICFSFVGALAAFLLYNFPTARVFMGDSGSTFLGFSLAVTAVLLTQGGSSRVDSMFPVLVLLIPIFDTLRVLLVRLRNGRSPFRADNLHLHYLMTGRNVPPVKVVLLFWFLTLGLGTIALGLSGEGSVSYLVVALQGALFLGVISGYLGQERQSEKKEEFEMRHPAGIGIDSR